MSDGLLPTEKERKNFRLAVCDGNKTAVAAFLDKHAGCMDNVSFGFPALTWAASNGHKEIVELLLDHGAAPDGNGQEWTPLMRAIQNGHMNIAKVLVDKGAEVNAKGEGGWTALMVAAWSGETEIVKFLLENGADIHQKGNHGDTARLFALRRKKYDTAEFLRQWPEMERERQRARELDEITKTVMGGLSKPIPYKKPLTLRICK